ncbi:uncharacterized protein LOC127095499 [Lathyrus oleraceus]|uniref:uncharacterized protein LOC127095499 n=1 Tax=Pisum sativum TaxID=3888 RepID=UPI0021CE8CE8|nr:uncharacterized protein LOC127095499 [Pisum sativum]
MTSRDDRLRYRRIAQHALVWMEKSQVLEAHVHSSHVDASTSGAHASPSSSSRRRRVSPTDASHPPSSHRRQVSLIQAPEVPESPVVPVRSQVPEAPHDDETSNSVSPPTNEVVQPVPPPTDEVAEDDESEPPQDLDPLKFINHGRKITNLPQPNEESFQAALSLSRMKDLFITGYITVNREMLNAFVERWYTKTSSFHLPLSEMSITLDDVSCLLRLLIKGKLLNHGRIRRDETPEMMVDYLRVDPKNAMMEFKKTIGAHARFEFLKMVYTNEILRADEARCNDEQVVLHRAYAMRAYLLYLVGTAIFMDNSVTYMDVIYLRYFENFERIHEYNWEVACLVYLYSKL